MKDEDIVKDESVMSDDSHENKKKNKKILLYVLKKHKIGILLIVFLLMLSSTFAWFIFNRTVDMRLHAKVKAWNIVLGNTTSTDVHKFVVDDLYPGIDGADPATNTVSIQNDGEVSASVKIQVKSIKLFGEDFGGTTCVNDEALATGDLKCIISTNASGQTVYTLSGFPFVITFTLSSTEIAPEGKSSLIFDLFWEYERDDEYCFIDENGNQTTTNYCDIEDTEYGEKSYEFHNDPANEGKNSLEIELRLDITQVN